MSDLRLEDGKVIVDAVDLEVRSHVANRYARGADRTNRRALVHDSGDKITINFGGDYPGGVRVQGKVIEFELLDLQLAHPDRRRAGRAGQGQRRALVHDFDDSLAINFAGDYPGGVKFWGDVRMDGDLKVRGRSVATDLAAITQQLADLQRRVEELEQQAVIP